MSRKAEHRRISEARVVISFGDLREKLQAVSSVVQYLRPEFLDEIAESCEVDE